MKRTVQTPPQPESDAANSPPAGRKLPAKESKEIGGPADPEPTRYGDWERRGRCIDF